MKLKYDEPLSNFAFNSKLQPYGLGNMKRNATAGYSIKAGGKGSALTGDMEVIPEFRRAAGTRTPSFSATSLDSSFEGYNQLHQLHQLLNLSTLEG